MSYAFGPVAPDIQTDGCYVQFDRVFPAITRADMSGELAFLRIRLLLSGLRRATGHSRPGSVAGMLRKPGVTYDAVRHRISVLKNLHDYEKSARRKNGIVNACKSDLAGRSVMVDAILDDSAPVWLLARRQNWSLMELRTLRPMIERMGIAVPSDTGEVQDIRERYSDIERAAHDDWQSNGWPVVNVMFFCLHRALAVGDFRGYGMAYQTMLEIMVNLLRPSVAEGRRRIENAETCLQAVPLESLTVAPVTHDRLMLADFWWYFGNYLQNWYSRVQLFDMSYITDAGARFESHMRLITVRAIWQVIVRGEEHFLTDDRFPVGIPRALVSNSNSRIPIVARDSSRPGRRATTPWPTRLWLSKEVIARGA
ncbi:hypothetical protein SB861_28510 [Paraburkholderia sp. SIMBA_049]